MARKPSYDFERREREKAKAMKAADRAKAKTEKRSGQVDAGDKAGPISVEKMNSTNDE